MTLTTNDRIKEQIRYYAADDDYVNADTIHEMIGCKGSYATIESILSAVCDKLEWCESHEVEDILDQCVMDLLDEAKD